MDEERKLIPSTEEFDQDSIREYFAFLHNLDPAVREAAVRELMYAAEDLQKRLARCESPIEQLLYFALDDMARFCSSFMVLREIPGYVSVHAQADIETARGQYRADFLVYALANSEDISIVIECDGHEFHERTKKQAAHDKARDRAFAAAGHTVLHFTGSEIWRDWTACADEVKAVLAERTGIGF
jgi:very-short-patch-repair endonuclease